MEQSSSYDEKTVRHQFDRKCKLALKGEVVDYERHLAYLILSILVDTFISKISLTMQPGPKIDSISGA